MLRYVRMVDTSQTCEVRENICIKTVISAGKCCDLKMTSNWISSAQIKVFIKTCEVRLSLLMTAPVQPGSHRLTMGGPWPQTVTAEPDLWRPAGQRRGRRHWLLNRAGSTDEPSDGGGADLPHGATATISSNTTSFKRRLVCVKHWTKTLSVPH